jgi:AraC-like DNA-binding protein
VNKEGADTMWELFDKTDLGKNVQNIIETEDCKIMQLHDETGDGMMTIYQVFPGAFLMYNDFHMNKCVSGFQTDESLLCIDHCREGRIEQEISEGAYCYLEAGDLRVDSRTHHTGHVSFPLCHYHGISIGFQTDIAEKELQSIMRGFPVKLSQLHDKYCGSSTPFVIRNEPVIEHIFSEIYNVPLKIKHDYFRIKVLELLLFLDALEISDHKEERPYFYKSQVEKVKAIQALLISDLTKNYTIEELSEQFDIALTPLKNCFKSVYGSPIFTYMRTYRMNYAAALLKSNKEIKITDIAGMVGYDSPSKFSSAFRQEMGKTPLEYRKSFV